MAFLSCGGGDDYKVVNVTGVTLNKIALSLEVGQAEALQATLQPAEASNMNMTWTSSAPAVATVSGTGLVTAVAHGSATITVTTQDGNKTATCQVTVATAVTDVSLSLPTLKLFHGQHYSLGATVLPIDASNKAVIWSSDNPAVAVVDEAGVVTALSIGEAKITVLTVDGNFTAICEVTIS